MPTQGWERWRLVGVALGLLAAAAASPACRREPAAPEQPRTALASADVVARTRRATVIVTSGTCRGSGFFVTPTLLLTNAHVLCAETAEVRLGDHVVPAAVVQLDDELDVALLQTEGGTGSPLPLADALSVREGDAVAAAGAPADEGETVTVVAGAVARPVVPFWGVLHIEAELPLSPGNSGGPMVNARGEVVGVISKRRRRDGRSWALAVPINYVSSWLPAGVGVVNREWDKRLAATSDDDDPDLQRFQSALRQPMLLGAHYLPVSAGGGNARQLLVFVVAAPEAPARGLSELTIQLTCGDTTPVPTRLSAWVAIDQPLERTMRIDVTALRPFLAWARKRAHANGLALATGDASAAGEPVDCPGRRLALLDGATVTDSIAIE
ncbi:MAG: serine protease [Vicinamibacteraceae bacterium]